MRLGERHREPHPETGYVTQEVRDAFNATEAAWMADAEKKKLITGKDNIKTGLDSVRYALYIPATKNPWYSEPEPEAETAPEE